MHLQNKEVIPRNDKPPMYCRGMACHAPTGCSTPLPFGWVPRTYKRTCLLHFLA